MATPAVIKNKGNVIPVDRVWLSKREVREYLDVGDEWIEKYLYGEIHVYSVGKYVFFKLSEVNRFMEKSRIT